jgi:cellulose synthase/poly-beta-1,6-N-acetylglucosamine synthase-like glycosyltransferase
MSVLEGVVQYVATIVIVFTLVYVFYLSALGWRVSRAAGAPLGSHEALVDGDVSSSTADTGYRLYYLVPCLNEELVIEATVRALLDDGDGQVLVIDDGSDDATADRARASGADQVHVVRRTLPEARQGKGAALNAGLRWIRDDVEHRGVDPSKVVVCVMDADGRLTPGAARAAAACFDDPTVGGVQLVVRIRNRDSLILRFQDMEFWTMSGLTQLGRVATASVSMGGNGQFTRLAALDELGDEPWSDSLTEDLDLGLSLSFLGWKTTSTTGGYVTQQGVPHLRPLLRQRTRWYQGHMRSIRRVPELISSTKLSNKSFVELLAYLLVPWCITLPWSIVQQYLLVQMVLRGDVGADVVLSTSLAGRVGYLVTWYLISFAPHLVWGFLYWRRSEEEPLLRALVMTHLLVLWSYLAYLAAWRAFGRMLIGRNGWKKTARQAEDDHDAQPVPQGAG